MIINQSTNDAGWVTIDVQLDGVERMQRATYYPALVYERDPWVLATSLIAPSPPSGGENDGVGEVVRALVALGRFPKRILTQWVHPSRLGLVWDTSSRRYI